MCGQVATKQEHCLFAYSNFDVIDVMIVAQNTNVLKDIRCDHQIAIKMSNFRVGLAVLEIYPLIKTTRTSLPTP